jgi:hypothetical protein
MRGVKYVRVPLRGWWCRLREPPGSWVRVVGRQPARKPPHPTIALPPELFPLYVAGGEEDPAEQLLMLRWDASDARSDEEVERLLAVSPHFSTCRPVWVLAYPDCGTVDDSDPWEERVRDEDWEAGVRVTDFAGASGEWGRALFRFKPGDRCLAEQQESLNRYFVYDNLEDVNADRIRCYPRLALLAEIGRGADRHAELARRVFAGDEGALPALVEAMKARDDPRAERVGSWGPNR